MTGRALPDIVLRDVGCCIYCGTDKDLTDEHIVPAALNGNWVLRAAVCERCRVITSRAENTYLQSIKYVRYALGMGAKRQKDQHSRAPVLMTIGNTSTQTTIALESHPNIILFPVFRRARVLEDPEGDQSLVTVGDPVPISYGRHPLEVAKQYGASHLHIQQKMPNDAFARMLAKIGYSFVVAKIGLEAFVESPALALCTGASNDTGRWVGTLSRESVPADDHNKLHRVVARAIYPSGPKSEQCVIHSHITLLSNSTAPTYEVVVGIVDPTKLPPEFRPDSQE